MEKEKFNKSNIVHKEETSQFIFSMPIFLIISALIYLFNTNDKNNFLLLVLITLFVTIKSVLMFRGKKIIITKTKIYIFVNNKKFISWSFSDDFYIINYSQNFLGKIFGYGTLIIINKDKKMYEYFYLHNVEKSYHIIIETYEKLMQKLDPSFVVSYKDIISKKIDKID